MTARDDAILLLADAHGRESAARLRSVLEAWVRETQSSAERGYCLNCAGHPGWMSSPDNHSPEAFVRCLCNAEPGPKPETPPNHAGASLERAIEDFRYKQFESTRDERRAKDGAHLRRLRQHAGLTLKQVAEGAAISVAYLSDVERGRRGPLMGLKRERVCGVLLARAFDLASGDAS